MNFGSKLLYIALTTIHLHTEVNKSLFLRFPLPHKGLCQNILVLGFLCPRVFLGMPSKKKSPYGGTLSQLGGEGVRINFKMSLLKIPF